MTLSVKDNALLVKIFYKSGGSEAVPLQKFRFVKSMKKMWYDVCQRSGDNDLEIQRN